MRRTLRAGLLVAMAGLAAGAVPALGADACKPVAAPQDEAVAPASSTPAPHASTYRRW